VNVFSVTVTFWTSQRERGSVSWLQDPLCEQWTLTLQKMCFPTTMEKCPGSKILHLFCTKGSHNGRSKKYRLYYKAWNLYSSWHHIRSWLLYETKNFTANWIFNQLGFSVYLVNNTSLNTHRCLSHLRVLFCDWLHAVQNTLSSEIVNMCKYLRSCAVWLN
jgi:hypothetical protein